MREFIMPKGPRAILGCLSGCVAPQVSRTRQTAEGIGMFRLFFGVSCCIALLHGTSRAQNLAWWVTWSFEPKGIEVEGVPVLGLNQNWRSASTIGPSDLPAASRQAGERPEDQGLVFGVNVDLDGDSRAERAVVGVYESAQREIGRFLLVLGRTSVETPWTKKTLFFLKDAAPFPPSASTRARLDGMAASNVMMSVTSSAMAGAFGYVVNGTTRPNRR
jgi:hypothetical protein